jgi:predicted  nucleic acid-binding Zn-ribbon protein
MARLLFRDSQGREGTVELSPTETVYVGRGLECAIRTDDGMVSRRHSQIRMEGGRFVVEDLGSANGTHLNNIRVQKQALGHGDIVQCGSLLIRFIEEGAVNILQQPVPQGSAPPPKKGGTMVLERSDPPPLAGGYGQPAPAGYGAQPQYPPGQPQYPAGQPQYPAGQPQYPAGQPQYPAGQPQYPAQPAATNPGGGGLPYGGPPSLPGVPGYGPSPQMPAIPVSSGMPGAGMPGPPGSVPPVNNPTGFGAARGGGFGGSVGSQASATPYGGPPAMPSGTPNMPYGGPPNVPSGQPYGGPPAMPPPIQGAGSVTGHGRTQLADSPSVFGRGGPVGVPGPATRATDAADKKVLVDLGLEFDPNKADAEIKSLRTQLEKASASYEREVADGKRIRAESGAMRDRVEELKAQIKDREDQVVAHDRVADELRDELQQTRNELNRSRGELGEMAENMAARERQAARALEDTAKLREDIEDKNRQLMELSRTKDEGWKKLNEQLTEIEHLREVINEQERMLEERRVGLISQEEVIKELRSEKEKNLKSIAQLRAERDEAKTNASRAGAQITGLEEENRRLGRLLVEAQTEGGRGGAQPDHLMKMTNDIRELRVELKKVEADRERLEEQYTRTDRDREKLEGRLAQIEVELQEAVHGRLAAESARNVAQDALAKAEIARHKAAEEALSASKARDAASTGGDDARRELDRLRRKVAEFEKAQAAAAPAADAKELQLERETAERKLKDANERTAAAERSLKSLQAEVDAAKTDAAKARAEAARAKASIDAQAEAVIEQTVVTPVNGELARVAQEVYDAINDILSEMRNNMVLVQGELPKLTADPPTMQAVSQAVEALVDNAETAKGALRGLRDLANTGP